MFHFVFERKKKVITPEFPEMVDPHENFKSHGLLFGGVINVGIVVAAGVLLIGIVFLVALLFGPRTHEKEFLARQRQMEQNPQMRFMLEREGVR
jgi:hypothetical protein